MCPHPHKKIDHRYHFLAQADFIDPMDISAQSLWPLITMYSLDPWGLSSERK